MAKAVVIVGAQWGDEGKGKIVDCLTEKADIVVRYQGGNNAGHTVVIAENKFILHIIPSGILHKEKLCIIGNGVVINPRAFIDEVNELKHKGIIVENNLKISKNAHLIMPYHIKIEKVRETTSSSCRIGTTGRGIGPAYADKISRTGIRIGDFLYPEILKEKLVTVLKEINFILEKLYSTKGFDPIKIYDEYMSYGEKIIKYIDDTDIILNKALDENKKVLFEGAQGTLLDIDHGTYPYVTSSSASAGGVCTGTGVGPTRIDEVVGVVKAYTTRVGEGPFPTEIKNLLGDKLREKGGEYGATTGRPRRCGWLDIVALRHSVRINNLSGIIITKLDILDGLDTIKVCFGYEYKGRIIDEFPSDGYVLKQCKPLYKEFKGWKTSTSGIRDFNELPDNAISYIKNIEKALGVGVDIISTGQRREDIIIRKNFF